jgi:alcohol dehydrogenase, propanol-preferring
MSRQARLFSVPESLVSGEICCVDLLTRLAFHAVDSCALKPGQWLAVIGAGGLGQLAVQYAKAMEANVVAIDINDTTLENAKAQGANAIFNSKTNPDYVEEIKKLTNGGVHAAAVFSNAKQAYASAPSIIRTGGTLMVIGLPHEPLQISAMDLALQKYKSKSESTSMPQRMPKAIEFTAKHNISPEVDLRKGLESLAGMVEEMKSGKATKRMAIVFD